MQLILIRHAEARPANPGEPDADRPLTARGHAQAAALAAALKRVWPHPLVVATSHRLRARQTAEPFFDLGAGTTETPHLDPDTFDPVQLSLLAEFVVHKGDGMALLGHMNGIGEYVGWLTGGPALRFEVAGAACVEFAGRVGEGRGELKWFTTPVWYGIQGEPGA